MTENNKLQWQLELEGLIVHGETPVGWDENSLPNETVDQDGNLSPANWEGVTDPRFPSRRVYDDPSVEVLRKHLRQHNGIYGLEICKSTETKKATKIFHRDGFVVVRDLLNTEQLARFRRIVPGC